MKNFYLRLIILFSSATLQAQEHISQPDLKAEYDLPQGWKVQQYFKGDWDKSGGSSICACALAINILKVPNGDDFDYIHMVLYPSDKKGSMDPKRKQVWQYKINYRDDGDTLKGGKLEWVLYKGKLVAGGENRFKDCIAWKLTSNSDKVYYTLYFWTRATIFEQYRPYLDKIISSFKAIP